MRNRGNSGADYAAAVERLGSVAAAAREFGVNGRTVSRAISRLKDRDPAIQAAMNAFGTGVVPSVGLGEK